MPICVSIPVTQQVLLLVPLRDPMKLQITASIQVVALLIRSAPLRITLAITVQIPIFRREDGI